ASNAPTTTITVAVKRATPERIERGDKHRAAAARASRSTATRTSDPAERCSQAAAVASAGWKAAAGDAQKTMVWSSYEAKPTNQAQIAPTATATIARTTACPSCTRAAPAPTANSGAR